MEAQGVAELGLNSWQVSGYTRAAGAEAEHCNGDGALGQGCGCTTGGPTAAMGDRARQRELGGAGGCWNGNECPPPPPPFSHFIRS